MKGQWQKEVMMRGLKDFLKKNKQAVIIIFGVLIITIIYYFRYKTFVYVEFDAINISWLPKILLSAIGFSTIGAALYYLKFYYFLWKIGKYLFDFQTYKKIKAIVWFLVMISVWVCIQIIINVINKVIEITYNTLAFLLFF